MRIPERPIKLPKLPFALDALEPMINREVMEVHYLGHHKGYVDKFNQLLKTGGSQADKEFNYSGHILHTYYWNNLRPLSGNLAEPGIRTKTIIDDRYGSFANFKKEFLTLANSIKGSGWIIADQGLSIAIIPNHEASRLIEPPTIVFDVWEHGYYLQYKNQRKDFLDQAFKLLNWDKVEERLSA